MTTSAGRTTSLAAPPGAAQRVPGWVLALGIWLLCRVFTVVVTAVVARSQVENLWTSAAPGYLDFVGIWDAAWYQQVAEGGYPRPVPVDAFGRPVQSPWAFFPAYPALVRLGMEVTGLQWRVAAPSLSLLLGCLAAVAAYALFRLRASRRVALGGVTVLAVFPSVPVLQYAYADVLAVFALLTALYLLATRRYLWCLLPVVLLGLSRPVGLPFVAVVAVHLLVRVRNRRAERLLPREGVAAGMVGVVALVAPLLFPAAVALGTGRLDGYPAVQDAWRSGDGVRYFSPWWGIFRLYLGDRVGAGLLALLALGALALLASRTVRRLGPEMWAWIAAYTLYVAAVVEPYTPLLRQLLMFAPLALGLAAALMGPERRGPEPKGPGRRGLGRRGRRWVPILAWVVASLALQVLWIDGLWHFDPPTDLPP